MQENTSVSTSRVAIARYIERALVTRVKRGNRIYGRAGGIPKVERGPPERNGRATAAVGSRRLALIHEILYLGRIFYRNRFPQDGK